MMGLYTATATYLPNRGESWPEYSWFSLTVLEFWYKYKKQADTGITEFHITKSNQKLINGYTLNNS